MRVAAYWLIATGTALCLAGSASAMMVDQFLMRADALKAKGALAIFQKKEINALMTEVKTAAEDYRAEAEKRSLARDTSLGCPPPKGKSRLSSDDLLKHFRSMPPDVRSRTSVKAGLYDLMRDRFPCS